MPKIIRYILNITKFNHDEEILDIVLGGDERTKSSLSRLRWWDEEEELSELSEDLSSRERL